MSPLDSFGLVGQVLDGQFRVESVVGEGGFSVVYRGTHVGLSEPIAVKCLKLPTAVDSMMVESFVRRFRDESRIQYKLSQGSLSIARSLASGTAMAPATGALVLYMILEWLEGTSLAAMFETRRAAGQRGRALDEAIELLDGAAEGLAYAHAQGVVHRDLNPGNIFLASSRGALRSKVLDFGVAKVVSDHAMEFGPRAPTLAHIRIFSPAYGAPEQFDQSMGSVGSWSDVYALAQILVEVLRDKPSVEGEHLGDYAVVALDPLRRPTPRALGVSVSNEVEVVFRRALEVNPRLRWGDIGEFWGALKNAVRISKEQVTFAAAQATPALRLGPSQAASLESLEGTSRTPARDLAGLVDQARRPSTKTEHEDDPETRLNTFSPQQLSQGVKRDDEEATRTLDTASVSAILASTPGSSPPSANINVFASTVRATNEALPPADPPPPAVHQGQQRTLALSEAFTPPPAHPLNRTLALPGGPGGHSAVASSQGPDTHRLPDAPPRPIDGQAAPVTQASSPSEQPLEVTAPVSKKLMAVAIACVVLALTVAVALVIVVRQRSAVQGTSTTPTASTPGVVVTAANPLPPTPSEAVEPPSVPTAVATVEPTASATASQAALPAATASQSAPPPTSVSIAPTSVPVATVAPIATARSTPTASATASAREPTAFSASVAKAALDKAAALGACRDAAGASGPGAAVVVFLPEGSIGNITLDSSWDGKPQGVCIVKQLSRARVPAFLPPNGRIRYSFNVPK